MRRCRTPTVSALVRSMGWTYCSSSCRRVVLLFSAFFYFCACLPVSFVVFVSFWFRA